MTYLEIAVKYLPRDYEFEECKSLTGAHMAELKLIQAPRPTTPAALYIFLHECAHAYLHTGSGPAAPRYVEEMEAERWAQAKMEQHGVPVPPEMITGGKRYVAREIVQAERRGEHIDPLAVAFAGEYLTEMMDQLRAEGRA